jgi:hypothetical protein
MEFTSRRQNGAPRGPIKFLIGNEIGPMGGNELPPRPVHLSRLHLRRGSDGSALCPPRAVDYERDAELMRGLMRNGEGAAAMVTNGSLRSLLLHEQEAER